METPVEQKWSQLAAADRPGLPRSASSTGSSQNFMWILFGGRLPGLVNVYKKLKHMV